MQIFIMNLSIWWSHQVDKVLRLFFPDLYAERKARQFANLWARAKGKSGQDYILHALHMNRRDAEELLQKSKEV